MHRFWSALVVLVSSWVAACATPPNSAQTAVTAVGVIASDEIREASGLAQSLRRKGRLWVLNDGGSPAELHAVGIDGTLHGAVSVLGVENRDWEDLASFKQDGTAYLMIADIGDNTARHPYLSLHIVPEPDPKTQTDVGVQRSIHFVYPDGPQDAEAIAVDAENGNVYVLTKRSIPAKLYALPLSAAEVVIAAHVTTLDALPEPTPEDVRLAPERQDWHWQPTAMDFATDGSFASILTYRAVYHFERLAEQSWLTALSGTPKVVPLGQVRDAEALCIADDAVYVTVEGTAPALYRTAR